jgi:hypothetical protein
MGFNLAFKGLNTIIPAFIYNKQEKVTGTAVR